MDKKGTEPRDSYLLRHRQGEKTHLPGGFRLNVGLAGIRPLELVANEGRPHRVGFPNIIHQFKRTILGASLAQPPKESEKCGDTLVRGTVNPDAAALVSVHCLEERHQISFSWGAELDRNVHVLLAELPDKRCFVLE